jgi:hypothetical protein
MNNIRNIPLVGIKPVEPSSMIRDKLPDQKQYVNNPYVNNKDKRKEKNNVDFRAILEEELSRRDKQSKNIKQSFDNLSRFIKIGRY